MSGPALAGRSALVTGASRGLGLAVATAFAQEGARLVLSARVPEDLALAADSVRRASISGVVHAIPADLAASGAGFQLAAAALAAEPGLDTLVNNAGVYGPKGTLDQLDWQAWLDAIQINLISCAELYRALIPRFRSRGGKIVQISGGGATQPQPRISGYGASKAGIIRLMETVAEEERGNGVFINAVAPGALNTRMLEEAIAAGPDAVGPDLYARLLAQRDRGGEDPSNAAALCVFLASNASDGITGKLISAVWDPWRDLTAHATDLAGDLYTLRRIVPHDRGMDWGS